VFDGALHKIKQVYALMRAVTMQISL
jgi:hypothetical protein